MQNKLNRIGYGLLLYGICGFCFQMLYTAIIPYFCGEHVIGEVWFSWCSMIIPVYMASFPIFLLYMREYISVPVIKRKMSVKELFMCVLIGAALCGVGMIAGSGIDYFLLPESGTELDRLLLSSDICWRVLSAGIIAPVVEEIVFRKYLIGIIAPYSEKTAVIASGVLFALSHGNFTQFLYTILLGLFWGYVYLRTRNIAYTIILHMIFNLTTSIFTITIYHASKVLYSVWCIILIALGVIGGILIIKHRKRIYFNQMRDRLISRCFWGSKGIVLYISYCAALFMMTYL